MNADASANLENVVSELPNGHQKPDGAYDRVAESRQDTQEQSQRTREGAAQSAPSSDLGAGLALALSGDPDGASSKLHYALAKLREERAIAGRIQYMGLAALSACSLLLALYLFSEYIYPFAIPVERVAVEIWEASPDLQKIGETLGRNLSQGHVIDPKWSQPRTPEPTQEPLPPSWNPPDPRERRN